MKQKKRIIGILAILVLLTAILAIVHVSTRDRAPEGALMVNYQGKTTYIDLDKLTMVEVSGAIVNGKGEEKTISGRGVALFSLAPGEVRTAAVFSDDAYSAAVAIEEAEQAFLIVSEDGSIRLVVFGDANAKRDVKNVVKVEFS